MKVQDMNQCRKSEMHGRLFGGAGNDLLIGGLDDDTYVFKSGDGWDWLEDRNGLGRDNLTLGQGEITLHGGCNTFVAINDGAWRISA